MRRCGGKLLKRKGKGPESAISDAIRHGCFFGITQSSFA